MILINKSPRPVLGSKDFAWGIVINDEAGILGDVDVATAMAGGSIVMIGSMSGAVVNVPQPQSDPSNKQFLDMPKAMETAEKDFRWNINPIWASPVLIPKRIVIFVTY